MTHDPQCRAVQIEDGRYTGDRAFDPDNCDTCRRELADLEAS